MDLPREMYKNYVQRREDDLRELSDALSKSDIAPFRKVGHQLKGNASSFGFDELLTLAERMHNLNSDNISQDAPGIIDDLKSWVTSTKKKFENA